MIAVVWGVMTCSVVEIYRCFGGGCCQHLHGATPPSCHLFAHSAVSVPPASIYYRNSRQTTLCRIPEDMSFSHHN